LLRWKEPRFAYKNEKKQISWKQWLIMLTKFVSKYALAGLVIAILIEIFRSGKIPHSNSQMLIFVGIFAALGMFFWFLGLLVDFKSPEISMREKGILIYTPPDNYFGVAYETIQSCSFVKNKIGELEYNILEIKDIDGNMAFVEIDPNVKIEDITEILESKNVRIKPSMLKLI